MRRINILLLLPLIIYPSASGRINFNANYDLKMEAALSARYPTGSPDGDRTYVSGGFDAQNQDENIDVIRNFGGPVLLPFGSTGNSLTF